MLGPGRRLDASKSKGDARPAEPAGCHWLALTGNGPVTALAAFVVVGLAAGHCLGGLDSDDRPVLALATACRHPGVAIAIAVAVFPEEKAVLLAAVLLYMVVSGLVSIP